MNFLIQSTTLNYKINHKMALYLKELYPGSKFGVIISAHGEKEKYLKEQNELEYEFIYDYQNIEKGFLAEEYSLDELKKFEETLPEKSLWRIIAMDRYFGSAFCKGGSKYQDTRQLLNGKICREEVLRVVSGYIKFINKILDRLKPDVVIFFPGNHTMMTPILEQCCKNLNILHMALDSSKIEDNYMITESTRLVFPQVEEMYKRIIKNEISADITIGKRCYDEMLQSVSENKGYSYHHKMVVGILSGLSEKRDNPKPYILLFARTLISTILDWYKNRASHKKRGKDISIYGIKYFFYNLRQRLELSYQSRKLLSKKLYDQYDPDVKYLYFPLTGQPEYATQVANNMWINQLTIIEALAKSIPIDWVIYVKDHPGTIGWRVRPLSYYKELREYPNVKLIPVDLNGANIIKNSEMVVTIASTSGWEAVALYNKPVINFSRSVYNVTGLAVQCTDLTLLSRLIHDEYDRINKISIMERRKRIVVLINALLMNSVSIDNPLATFSLRNLEGFTDDILESNAKKLAGFFKQHIDSSSR